MMNRRRTLATAAAILALAAGAASAQETKPHTPDPQRTAALTELFGTLTTWARAEILPSLTEWKGTLDRAMEPADLQQLNALRTRAAALKKRAMEHVRGMRKAWESEDYDALKTHREALKGMKKERKEIFEELAPLGRKYRSTLESIGESAKPKVQEWKTEGKEKVMTWLAANREKLGDSPGRLGGMLKGWQKFSGFKGDMKKKMVAARFMLWDGSDLTRDFDPAHGITPFDGEEMELK